MTPEEEKKILLQQQKTLQQQGLSNDINATQPPTSFGNAVPKSGFDSWLDAAKKPATATAENEEPTKPSSTTEPTKTYNSYEDVMKMLEGKIESDAERKAREKREKSRAMVNSIADMGRALANLYYTNQGSPNAYSQENSLSEAYQTKLDKAKAERDKNRDWWVNYALTQAKLKQGDAAAEAEAANTASTLKLKERELAIKEKEQADKEANRKAKAEAQNKYYEALSSKNYEQAAFWKEKTRLLDLGYDDKHAATLAKIHVDNTRAEYNIAKTENERNGKITTTIKTVDDPVKGNVTTEETVKNQPIGSMGNTPPPRGSGNDDEKQQKTTPSKRKK